MRTSDIRQEFPLLNQQVNGYPLVYLDNAASTQKPESVLSAIGDYYRSLNSNVHRGVHHLSQQATSAFEDTREYVRNFMGASAKEEIIFTRGTTEAVNLLAESFSRGILSPADTVLATVSDHHSNFVPWQQACLRSGAKFDVLPVQANGTISMELLEEKLRQKPRIVVFPHISNVLGIVNPVKQITAMAHAYGALVLVDGAQGIAHCPVNVCDFDCDFYVWSGHKIYGPTGIGVLYGKKALLEQLPPYQFGGEMIEEVEWQQTSFAALPYKFEAGTPAIAEGIALKTALEFVHRVGFDAIGQHEADLVNHAFEGLKDIEGIEIYGEKARHSGVISFNVKGVYHYDIGVILDQMGIAVRTGHHCAQPLMKFLNIPGCVRCSFAIYNTVSEVEYFVESLQKALRMLR